MIAPPTCDVTVFQEDISSQLGGTCDNQPRYHLLRRRPAVIS